MLQPGAPRHVGAQPRPWGGVNGEARATTPLVSVEDVLAAGFRDAAASAMCRGFAVGRTIFQDPAQRWLEGAVDDATLKQAIRVNFEGLIDAWQSARRTES